MLVLLALSAVILALGGGFLLGQRVALQNTVVDLTAYRSMEAELPRARQQVAELRSELDVVQTRHAVDREALELVRREIALQKEQIASLEEGINFYRSFMAPGEIAQGLSLRFPELVARDAPATYAFRIVVQQEARKHNLLKGGLSAEIIGLREGQEVSYPLEQLSEDIENGEIALRFRYFQAIEGELTLPEGFEPVAISVVATSSSPRKSEVSERFTWQLQEKFTHVGK
jgi:hypothetical protein